MDVINFIIFCKVLWDPWILNHWLFLLMGLSNLVFRSLSKLQTKISSTSEMLLWNCLWINFLFSEDVNKHQDQRGVLEWWQHICCSSWSWIPGCFCCEIHRRQLPQPGSCCLYGWCSPWRCDFFSFLPCRRERKAGGGGRSCSKAAVQLHSLSRECSTQVLLSAAPAWELSRATSGQQLHGNAPLKAYQKIKGQKWEKMAEGGFVEGVVAVWCSSKHLCHLILRYTTCSWVASQYTPTH